MLKPQLLPAVTLLVFLTGCAELPSHNASLTGLSNCPLQSASALIDQSNEFNSLSDSHSLSCALSTLRDSQDPLVRRSALSSQLCLQLAERETNPQKREQLANEGVSFAEIALAQGGAGDGAVHYYLATNLGLAIRDHIIEAMHSLERLEQEMKQALALSPELDEGGPLRILGMLYLKAPAWPKGIGDHDKALELLEKAAADYPDHPLNHLFYAQALWADGDETALPQVKAEFALGEKLLQQGCWGYSKAAWEKEFTEFKQEIGLAI